MEKNNHSKKDELNHFHPLHPTTFRYTVCPILDFLCERGTTLTMHSRLRGGAADSGKTMLNKARGQGDKKRTSFEKQKWCIASECVEVPGRKRASE